MKEAYGYDFPENFCCKLLHDFVLELLAYNRKSVLFRICRKKDLEEQHDTVKQFLSANINDNKQAKVNLTLVKHVVSTMKR